MAKLSSAQLLSWLSTLLLLAFAFADPNGSPNNPSSTAVLPPSRDPFYTAPHGYEHAAPGTILRTRRAPGNLTQIYAPNCSAAHHILYRTTDSNYKPSWAVTTLYIPQTPRNAANVTISGASLLTYNVYYDSADVDRSPSYGSYFAPPEPAVSSALGLGWYVNVPDYEGPKASLLAGVQSGHAVLDSIRASLHSNLGLFNNTKLGMYGYSGGSFASEWAAELQEMYAPELKIGGVALGGLLANGTDVALAINGKLLAGILIEAFLGITSQDVPARKYLVSQLKQSGPYNATGFFAVQSLPLPPNYAPGGQSKPYPFQNIFNYFVDGEAVLWHPSIQEVFNRDAIMGRHGIPRMPILAFHAIKDEFCPIPYVDKLIDKYCAAGANIHFQRNTNGGHVTEGFLGPAKAINFLSAIFDGTYASKDKASGCTIQNVTEGPDNEQENIDLIKKSLGL